MKLFNCIICLLFMVAGASFSAETEEDFTPLFNGKNLEGWTVEHGTASDVKIQNEVLYIPGSNHYPFWIRSNNEYDNFDLRFEFKMSGWCNSGVFYHAPLHGRNSKVGFEYQIDHKSPRNEPPSVKTCGGIFAQITPRINNIRGDEEWNEGRIVVEWPYIKHFLNGEKVVDININNHPELKYRFRRGYIGLQGLGYNVWFRNIRIKELPCEDQWVSLFNGDNLEGWYKEGGEARWSVEDGVMHAVDGTSYMVTEGEWQDFYYQTYVRTSENANGGIFVRWNTLKGGDRGNEIQIENVPDSNYPTGSLYNVIRAEQPPFTDHEWFPMQIYMNGPHCVVRVNGETTFDTHDFPTVRSGHISLQMHSHNKYIDFKGHKIMEIK